MQFGIVEQFFVKIKNVSLNFYQVMGFAKVVKALRRSLGNPSRGGFSKYSMWIGYLGIPSEVMG
jgi:hypothetical protein